MFSLKTFTFLFMALGSLTLITAHPVNKPAKPTAEGYTDIPPSGNAYSFGSDILQSSISPAQLEAVTDAFRQNPKYADLFDTFAIDLLDQGFAEKIGANELQEVWDISVREDKEKSVKDGREASCPIQ
jgi:hypothetical protein